MIKKSTRELFAGKMNFRKKYCVIVLLIHLKVKKKVVKAMRLNIFCSKEMLKGRFYV